MNPYLSNIKENLVLYWFEDLEPEFPDRPYVVMTSDTQHWFRNNPRYKFVKSESYQETEEDRVRIEEFIKNYKEKYGK